MRETRILTTMAVVQAGADEGKDYVANFEPFALDCLKEWPKGSEVTPHELAEAICERWAVPSLPINVAKILVRRAKRGGYLATTQRGEIHPNREALLSVRALAERSTRMQAQITALEDAVVLYANEARGLSWTREDAAIALERLTEQYGTELALAKRQGHLVSLPSAPEMISVVHGYARDALKSDPENFERLVAMVQGTMLTNTLYFEDVGHLSSKLPKLRVYLDTSILLRALGLESQQVVAATTEMLDMLRSFSVPLHAFHHTVEETAGVLNAIAIGLRRGRRGLLSADITSARSREAIDTLIRRGSTAGEVERLQAELPARLADLGVSRVDVPDHAASTQIDEDRLKAVLARGLPGQRELAQEKDVLSLAAIDRLRGRERPRDLADAGALFVTDNHGLQRASRRFFSEAQRSAPVPHCALDIALTAELWVRSPHRAPDLPRKLLVADCYAALQPDSRTWERWVNYLQALHKSGEITEERVLGLVYHAQAKDAFLEVTNGSAAAIDRDAVFEVLERFEERLREPAEAAADEARELADAALRSEESTKAALRSATASASVLGDQERSLRAEVETLRGRIEDQEARHKHRRERNRRLIGCAGLAVSLVVAVLVGILGDSLHRLLWAGMLYAAVAGGASSFTWGWRRPWAYVGKFLVLLGGLTALYFALVSVAPS